MKSNLFLTLILTAIASLSGLADTAVKVATVQHNQPTVIFPTMVLGDNQSGVLRSVVEMPIIITNPDNSKVSIKEGNAELGTVIHFKPTPTGLNFVLTSTKLDGHTDLGPVIAEASYAGKVDPFSQVTRFTVAGVTYEISTSPR